MGEVEGAGAHTPPTHPIPPNTLMATAVGNSIRQWQWPLLLQYWAMEQAGNHEEFNRDPEWALDLLDDQVLTA